MNVGNYTKAILAAFIAAGGSITTSLQDGHINGAEWIAAAITFVVAAGAVFAVPNIPESVRVYGKAIAAALTAGLGSLGTAFTDGVVTPAEVITIVTALVVGAGLVSIAPNAEASDGDLGEDIEVDPESVPEATVPQMEYPGGDDGTGLDAAPPEHAA